MTFQCGARGMHTLNRKTAVKLVKLCLHLHSLALTNINVGRRRGTGNGCWAVCGVMRLHFVVDELMVYQVTPLLPTTEGGGGWGKCCNGSTQIPKRNKLK